MSVGPGPALGGSLIVWPESAGPVAIDSMGDVMGLLCGGGGACSADGGPGGTDNVTADSSSGGSGGFTPSGSFFGMVQQSLMYVPGSPVGADAPCQPTSEIACVAPESRIALFPDGCKLACELCVGDLLLTRDAEGQPAGEPVVKSVMSEQPRIIVETRDGRRLLCSLSHELIVADDQGINGGFKRASELTLADRLVLEDGTATSIDSISTAPAGNVVLVVMAGPNHIYLTDGLWSHNKATPVWPPP